jgi:hypothetical protein
MDTLSIICLLVKLFVLWFHSVCGSLFDGDQLLFGSRFLPDTFFLPDICLNDISMKSITLPAELFLDDRHTLPLSVWIFLSTPFRLDFVCPIFRLAFYRPKLLRSLFLWQSCFSMVGILRHLRELFFSHLLDWIFLSVAFIDRDYYALCFFGRVAS